jgi:enoyl-CoA hydratase/carnithine racemase
MTTLQGWFEAACAELDVHADESTVRVILDLARDVAHQVERPAAPVTSFVLGLAVGAGMSLAEAAERLRVLAATWPAPTP